MRTTLRLCTIITGLLLFQPAAFSQQQLDSISHAGEPSDGKIRFLKFRPTDYGSQKHPLIIFLHGLGEIERAGIFDVDTIAKVYRTIPWYCANGVPMRFTVAEQTSSFVVLSPQLSRQYTSWPTFYVKELIKYAKANLQIDTNRIYITGLSLGGGGTWFAASETTGHPPVNVSVDADIAAIAPVASTNGIQNQNAFCATIVANNVPVWTFAEANDNIGFGSILTVQSYLNTCSPTLPIKFTIYGDAPTSTAHAATWVNAYDTGHITRKMSDNSTITFNTNLYEWFLSNTRAASKPSCTNNILPTIATTTTANLSWNAATYATSYDVYLWTGTTAPTVRTYNTNATNYTATGLTPATLYNWYVVPKNAKGAPTAECITNKTTFTTAASGIVPGCTSNTLPTNGATIATSITAALSWATAANAASYDVYVWTGVTPPATPIANVTATTYDAQGLTAATIYNWYVVPKNAAGSSTGCDASKTTFKTNQLPVAIVTPPSKTLILPTNSVTLDGSASYDPDGTISQYYWSMYSGPSTPTFNPFNPSITLSGLVEGTYIFMLQAKDNNGTPNWASCTITVSPSSGGGNQNIDPKPYPGPNQIIYLPNNSASRSTSLNGSESYDPDGSIEAYYWEQVNVQNSPNICTITDPTSITGITTATNLLQGTYYFRLHVRDNNHVVVVSDIKTVEVRSSSSTNVLPQALPGRDLTITYPVNAVLNGSTSYDPDGFIEAYYWVQADPQSSPNTCTITNQASPSGITTATNLLPGTYYFVLHVRDNNHVVVVSARKKVTVTATSPRVMISPTTTEAIKDAGRLRIYPNPLKTGTASIEINSGGKGLKIISLYNSTGVLVRKYTWQTIKGKNIFSLKNISDLTAGVYMVDIRDEHGKSVGNLKFIKQ